MVSYWRSNIFFGRELRSPHKPKAEAKATFLSWRREKRFRQKSFEGKTYTLSAILSIFSY